MGDIAGSRRFAFPAGQIIQPGTYLAVYCDKTADSDAYAPFEINRSGGENFYLVAKNGAIVDSVTTLPLDTDQSMILVPGDQWSFCGTPTPGRANDAPTAAYGNIYNPDVSSVRISEFTTSESTFLPEYEIFSDWVELHNTSSANVDISGFSLSDNTGNDKFVFPQGTTIGPMDYLVVYCTDRVSAPSIAPFGLSGQASETLVLKNQKGMIVDIVHSHPERSAAMALNLDGLWDPTQTPSPGYENTPLGYAQALSAIGASEGTIRISEVMSAEQFLLADQFGEFSDWVELYNTSGQPVSLDGWCLSDDPLDPQKWMIRDMVINPGECRLIICSGRDTITSFAKKTFALRFQNRYDGPLYYDVFEDGEVTCFSSLLIRTAHESMVSSQMHDALICQIAAQNSDKILSQKYKYVSLYLNGEYWGLYAIRERHSEEHYASYMNEPAEGVNIVRFMIDEDNSLHDLYNFCEFNSLASSENYAYAKTVLDMESYADWIIFEAYMANIDINANLRFYQSPVDGLWRMGLSDLDLGMVGSHGAFEQVATTFHHNRLVSALMANEEFQVILATRLAQLLDGPLSDDNMIATIHQMADTIRPETYWEQRRWGTPVASWEATVQEMIDFCDGRSLEMINSLCGQLQFTQQEREFYFGHLLE